MFGSDPSLLQGVPKESDTSGASGASGASDATSSTLKLYRCELDHTILIRRATSFSDRPRDVFAYLTEFTVMGDIDSPASLATETSASLSDTGGRRTEEAEEKEEDTKKVAKIIDHINAERMRVGGILNLFDVFRNILRIAGGNNEKEKGKEKEKKPVGGEAGVDDDDNGPIVAEGCRESLPVLSTTDQASSMEQLYLTRIYVLMNAHTDCETSAQNVMDDIFAFLTAKHTRPDLVSRSQIPRDLTALDVKKIRRSKGMFYGIMLPDRKRMTEDKEKEAQ